MSVFHSDFGCLQFQDKDAEDDSKEETQQPVQERQPWMIDHTELNYEKELGT